MNDDSALVAEIGRLKRELMPATRREASAAIGVMVSAFGLAAGGENENLRDLYLAAAAECPLDVLVGLCEDITFGRIEGISLDFPPKVPRFARLVRERVDRRRATLADRQNRLRQIREPEPTPEQRKRVGKLFADLSESMRRSMEPLR